MKIRLTPYYTDLVHEALLKSFWRRKALDRFLRQCSIAPAFLATWRQDESKREFIDRLLPKLLASEAGKKTILKMSKMLMEQKTFPDLANWEDSADKIREAQSLPMEAAVAKLIYSAITSLDGYVADKSGRFDWAEPGEEAHAFITDLERSVGTYLYGRRIYEVMRAWEDLGSEPGAPSYIQEYAKIWQAADKIVYSRTLQTVSTARTRIEREFDVKAVREMKAAATGDIGIAGPTLAAEAIKAGLVDDYYVLIAPMVVGGGLRFLPDGIRLDLELLDERRFVNGMVYLRYGNAAG